MRSSRPNGHGPARHSHADREVSSAPGLRLTASFGVTEYAGQSHTEQLVAAADEALYRAKRAGKDRVKRAPAAPF